MSGAALGLPIGKAAEYLGVHVDTLRAWAAAGKIRATRTGGDRWRFTQDALDNFVAERTNVTEEASA